MSIEKYLNEINEEVANESVLGSIAVIALLSTAIGVVGNMVNYKKNKEERKRKLEDEKRSNEFKKNKEEYLKANAHLKDSIINAMQNDARKMVNVAKRNKDIIQKMKDDIERNAEDYGLSASERKFSLTFDDAGDYIEIINGEQQLRSILHWFIEDMATVLKDKYYDAITYGLVSVGTGDGDEGCIYIE